MLIYKVKGKTKTEKGKTKKRKRKRKKRKAPKNIVANQTSKPPIKTISQKSQDDLEPIEESQSTNKDQSVENKSLPQSTNDPDSTP